MECSKALSCKTQPNWSLTRFLKIIPVYYIFYIYFCSHAAFLHLMLYTSQNKEYVIRQTNFQIILQITTPNIRLAITSHPIN